MPCILRSKKSKRYRRHLAWRKMFNPVYQSPDQELAERTRDFIYQGLINGYNAYMRQCGTGNMVIYEYLLASVTGDDWYIEHFSQFLTPSQLERYIEEHITDDEDDIGLLETLLRSHAIRVIE